MFSSTTVRAKETAEIISNELGYEFEMDSRLREIELGELEGKTLLEVDKKYANVIRDFSEKPSECEIPGGESVPQVQQRVLSFIYDRLDENNDLVIVSHDIAIRTFLVHAMSMSIDFIWSLSPSELMSGFQSPFEYGDKDIPLSSVSVVKYRDGEFIVKSIGMMVA
jgi:broad specificity phosphatase PhoE